MKRNAIEEVLAHAGIPTVADDDPRYREGPTVLLRSSGNAARVELDSLPEDVIANANASADESDVEAFNAETCPYCSKDTCAHHVVSIDLTDRQVIGGVLYEACSAYLSRRTDSRDEDGLDEAFDDLMAMLDDLPNVVGILSEFEGGPGQSSVFRHYWLEAASSMHEVAQSLSGMASP